MIQNALVQTKSKVLITCRNQSIFPVTLHLGLVLGLDICIRERKLGQALNLALSFLSILLAVFAFLHSSTAGQRDKWRACTCMKLLLCHWSSWGPPHMPFPVSWETWSGIFRKPMPMNTALFSCHEQGYLWRTLPSVSAWNLHLPICSLHTSPSMRVIWELAWVIHSLWSSELLRFHGPQFSHSEYMIIVLIYK